MFAVIVRRARVMQLAIMTLVEMIPLVMQLQQLANLRNVLKPVKVWQGMHFAKKEKLVPLAIPRYINTHAVKASSASVTSGMVNAHTTKALGAKT
jgi:hypothetical protein